MPSAAQWHPLSNRAKYASDSVSLLLVADVERPPLERVILEDAMRLIKDVLDICDKRQRAASPSSFDKILRQTSGASSAYETANEKYRSAHESIMFLLAMEQRKSAHSAAKEIDRLGRHIRALETSMGGTNYNITGSGSTVVVVKGNNSTKVEEGKVDVLGEVNSNAANYKRFMETEDVVEEVPRWG